jgi:hypothetical protein
MTAAKMILKDTTNWWLSYLLAQPVDFDMAVLFYFLVEYAGCISVLSWRDNLHSVRSACNGIFFRKRLVNS